MPFTPRDNVTAALLEGRKRPERMIILDYISLP